MILNSHHASWFVFVFHSGGGNMVAIDLIVQHVHSQLEEVHTHADTLAYVKLYFQVHKVSIVVVVSITAWFK